MRLKSKVYVLGGGWGREQDKRTKREKTNKLSKDPDSREGELTIFIESF